MRRAVQPGGPTNVRTKRESARMAEMRMLRQREQSVPMPDGEDEGGRTEENG